MQAFVFTGARARIRTGDLPLRRRLLYPAELQARVPMLSRPDGARTLRILTKAGGDFHQAGKYAQHWQSAIRRKPVTFWGHFFVALWRLEKKPGLLVAP